MDEIEIEPVTQRIDLRNPIEDTSLAFHVGTIYTPIIELKSNGDIYVKGRRIINDMEVVEGMRELLNLNRNVMDNRGDVETETTLDPLIIYDQNG